MLPKSRWNKSVWLMQRLRLTNSGVLIRSFNDTRKKVIISIVKRLCTNYLWMPSNSSLMGWYPGNPETGDVVGSKYSRSSFKVEVSNGKCTRNPHRINFQIYSKRLSPASWKVFRWADVIPQRYEVLLLDSASFWKKERFSAFRKSLPKI